MTEGRPDGRGPASVTLMRDYGTATWIGGDAECDHIAKKRKNLDSGLRNDGRKHKGLYEGEKATEITEYYRDTCGKCGATRVDNQLGLEPTPEQYVANMVAVFREVRRVMRPDGTLWLNLGDSYNGSGKGATVSDKSMIHYKAQQLENKSDAPGLKTKDLVGIPWRVAFALQQPDLRCKGCEHVAHKSEWGKFPNGRLICPNCVKSNGWIIETPGWWLRSEIIWYKTNPMPESVTDRPTKSHEQLFLFSPSAIYYYDLDAIREPHAEASLPRALRGISAENKWIKGAPGSTAHTMSQARKNKRKEWEASGGGNSVFDEETGRLLINPGGRNKRTVWKIPTRPYKGAHFATFPTDLVEPCILAGTSEKGVCPDCGTPWVRVVETKPRPADEERIKEMEALGVPRYTGNLWKIGGHYREVENVLGWRPTCSCYPRVDEWQEYPSRVHISDEDYALLIEPIRKLRVELIEFWLTMETVPGIVLDPFSGAATTGLVCQQYGRDYIGLDLSKEYHDLARRRLSLEAWDAWVEGSGRNGDEKDKQHKNMKVPGRSPHSFHKARVKEDDLSDLPMFNNGDNDLTSFSKDLNLKDVILRINNNGMISYRIDSIDDDVIEGAITNKMIQRQRQRSPKIAPDLSFIDFIGFNFSS